MGTEDRRNKRQVHAYVDQEVWFELRNQNYNVSSLVNNLLTAYLKQDRLKVDQIKLEIQEVEKTLSILKVKLKKALEEEKDAKKQQAEEEFQRMKREYQMQR